jgi:fructosamine-3-kinase
MKKIIEDVVLKYYNINPERIIDLGGGFYSRVFRITIRKEPFELIIKIYLYSGIAEKEASQLKILSIHSLVKMPNIYFVHEADAIIHKDILIMEYIPGINAGKSDIKITEKNRRKIAEVIVDNLISYHNIINPRGFGEINSGQFTSDWRDFYKEKVKIILNGANKMVHDTKIDKNIFQTMEKAYNNFDKIFYLPITTARLIHGDYNTWNILLDEDLKCVKAVIDPYNCCWGDSEMDLYQLNNANGKYYGLFDLYISKFSSSENMKIKICFYELFTEIMHCYNANVDTKLGILHFSEEAKELLNQMNNYGI